MSKWQQNAAISKNRSASKSQDGWIWTAYIESNHISYTFIKNSIAAVAEDIGAKGYNTKLNEERNKGAFILDSHAGDISTLLSKSSRLAENDGKEDSDNEEE